MGFKCRVDKIKCSAHCGVGTAVVRQQDIYRRQDPGICFGCFLSDIKKQIFDLQKLAGQDDHLRVEQIYKVGDANTQIFSCLFKDFAQSGITISSLLSSIQHSLLHACGIPNINRCIFLAYGGDTLADTTDGAEAFQTPTVTARASGTVFVENHMSQFTGGTVVAADHLPFENVAHTDTARKTDQRGICMGTELTVPLFCQSNTNGVMIDMGWDPEAFFENCF